MTENQKEAPKRRDPLLKPVERRTFLRYSLAGSIGLGTASFGAAVLGQLWPDLSGGFGAKITLPIKAADLLQQIRDERAPFEYPAGRLYLVAWEPDRPGADDAYGADHVKLGDSDGLMALYQKCVHLGCRVPWCQTSQWFECPCHGSKYNRYGEWMDGPAPRGLDRFPSELDGDGNISINTGVILTGPARTARVLQQSPEGPNCVDV